jgi:hypothetical protein
MACKYRSGHWVGIDFGTGADLMVRNLDLGVAFRAANALGGCVLSRLGVADWHMAEAAHPSSRTKIAILMAHLIPIRPRLRNKGSKPSPLCSRTEIRRAAPM